MHDAPSIGSFLLTSLAAGILGAAAMECAMWLICRAGWARGNMIVAVGSLFTRSRANAFRAGAALHAVSAVVFAMIYYLAMLELGLASFPQAIYAGIGFGVIHGMIVSLMLVWVVAERHPLEEFQEAGFAVGVSHFAGHIAYGAAIGLVIAIARG
jgi:hypothetical protein